MPIKKLDETMKKQDGNKISAAELIDDEDIEYPFMRKCTVSNCRFNRLGFCSSNTVNRNRLQCDKDNKYKYFEERK